MVKHVMRPGKLQFMNSSS